EVREIIAKVEGVSPGLQVEHGFVRNRAQLLFHDPQAKPLDIVGGREGLASMDRLNRRLPGTGQISWRRQGGGDGDCTGALRDEARRLQRAGGDSEPIGEFEAAAEI